MVAYDPHVATLDRVMRVVRRLVPAAGAIALAWFAPGARQAWGDTAVGVALALVGALATIADRRSVTGPLIALAGCAWFFGNFSAASVGWIAACGERTLFVHRAVLAHAAVSVPTGRPRPWTWLALGPAYALALWPDVMRSDAGATLWAALVVAAAAADVVQRPEAARLGRAGALVTSGALAAIAATRLHGAAYQWGLVVVGAMAAGVTALVARRRAALADTVIELVHGPDDAVQAAFAEALGDASVEVVFAAGDRWVDEFGTPVPDPLAGTGRHVSIVDADGSPVAAVVHNAAWARDPALARAIAQAARLAAELVRLRADLHQATEATIASRGRVAVAASAARAGISEAIRTGPGASLAAAEGELTGAGVVGVTLAAIRTGIDDLIEGLGPLASTGGRLIPALESLVRRSPMSVELSIDLHADSAADPAGSAAEALWFVCAEGLSNVVKHAGCDRATVRLSAPTPGTLELEVADHGRGGAALAGGTGLLGLTDRVAGVGGALRVETSPAGTRLVARVPTD